MRCLYHCGQSFAVVQAHAQSTGVCVTFVNIMDLVTSCPGSQPNVSVLKLLLL